VTIAAAIGANCLIAACTTIRAAPWRASAHAANAAS
jgi:hypothetical protein